MPEKYIVYLNASHVEPNKWDKYQYDTTERIMKFLNSVNVLVIMDNTQSTKILGL